MKNYLQVTDDDFAEAIGDGARSGATMVQQPVAPSGKNQQPSTQTPVATGGSADSCEWLPDDAESQNSGGGTRTYPKNTGKTRGPGKGGAKSGAKNQPSAPADLMDLARIVASWSSLPAHIRLAMIALLDAAGPSSHRASG